MVAGRGNAMEKQFDEVASALLECVRAKSAIIDGEVVALDEEGVPGFQLLQNRMGFSKSLGNKERGQKLSFFPFDLLYLDGFDLRKSALLERRQLLGQILQPSDSVRYSEHFTGKGAELLQAVRERGLEAIGAKNAGNLYESKRRSNGLHVNAPNQPDLPICVV